MVVTHGSGSTSTLSWGQRTWTSAPGRHSKLVAPKCEWCCDSPLGSSPLSPSLTLYVRRTLWQWGDSKAILGYHSDDVSRVNTLHDRKLHSRSRMSHQSSISNKKCLSLEADSLWQDYYNDTLSLPLNWTGRFIIIKISLWAQNLYLAYVLGALDEKMFYNPIYELAYTLFILRFNDTQSTVNLRDFQWNHVHMND